MSELTDEQWASVVDQVKRRKQRNEERIAELGIDLTPEGIAASGAALMRQRLDERRAAAAEAAGQLDLGGADTP